MNDAERDQIRLILADLVDRAEIDVAARKKAIFAEHSAKGLLRSGATIRRGQRELEQRASELVADAVHQVKTVDMSMEAFAMIAEAVERFTSKLATEFDDVIKIADGPTDPEKGDSAARRAALDLFREGDGRVSRQLELHRFSFTVPSRSDLARFGAALPTPVPASNPSLQPAARPEKGGRPPAEFWDDLWSHIAASLYRGELIPKNQADVEKAMAEWIESQGYSAATSTIRGRARRIWDRLAAPDDA